MRVLEGQKELLVVNMRTLCDACESAAAVLFCAADEASLCRTCDDKIHMCNKLASRHVRVGLADAIDVRCCDICENTPDGSSLCLQCDMAVHVGGKRNHGRYLLFRQRVEFPGDNVGHAKDLTLQLMGEDENKMGQNQSPKPTSVENQKNHRISPDPISNTSAQEHAKRGTNVFDLNMKPHKIHGEASNYQVLAKKFGAAVVTLEHRYYGKSSPFKSLTTENLKYLSSNHALFDLAVFRQYYQETLNVKLKRLGVENPWFFFGVSYSGALSAWFRLKFPHLTCGSLASSGVVLAVYNFTEFDQQVGESAGPECKAVLQEITTLVDQRLTSDGKSLKTLFDADELKIDGDFLYFLADAAVIAFQYGNPDRLCSPLIEAKNAGVDLVNAYAKYVKEYYVGSFGASPQTYNQQHLKKTALSGDSGDRLWWFQVCTEVAYFQVAPANDSIRSSKVDTRYHLDLCKNVFGEGIYPEVEITNIYYGGTKIAGSKIVFTNGSQDPWRHASKQTSSPDMPSYIITCHNCGHGTDLRGCPQSPLSPEGNAQNCSSPDAVHKVRQQIIEHIDLWLSQCQSADV